MATVRPVEIAPTEETTTGGDAFVAAAGNASLLGIGYLLLGRRRIAVATGLVTILLLVLVLVTASLVLEILLVLWWAAMIVHGWRLARAGSSTAPGRRAQWIAVVPAVVVLLAFGLLRFDAGVRASAVDDARRGGDCPRAVSTQDDVWFGPRLANAPATARGDETAEICAQIASARADMDQVFSGNVTALGAAYDRLAGLAARHPDHEAMVAAAVDGFVTQLPARPACTMAAVADDLARRPPTQQPSIDRLRTATEPLHPAALLGCGDALFGQRDWTEANRRYQQLITEFPRDPLATRARTGAAAAVAGRERDEAAARLPQFCATPFAYRGAPPPGPGLNRVLLPSASPDLSRLPAEWRANDITQGALVICAGTRGRGSLVRTCPYVYANRTFDVRFYRITVPLKVYDFHTGRLALDTRLEVSGTSCPPTVTYLLSPFDPLPGSDPGVLGDLDALGMGRNSRDVEVSDADVDSAVRSALTPLVVR